MLKAFYIRRQYFFNMLAVLIFLVLTRLLDGFAWYPPFPEKTKMLLIEHLAQFVSFFPLIFLLIFSYTWAIKRKMSILLYFLIITYAILSPAFVLCFSSW
ncbi:MAG: hypothetical protein ACD_77C00447G0001, partial [uncultured bacterium]